MDSFDKKMGLSVRIAAELIFWLLGFLTAAFYWKKLISVDPRYLISYIIGLISLMALFMGIQISFDKSVIESFWRLVWFMRIYLSLLMFIFLFMWFVRL